MSTKGTNEANLSLSFSYESLAPYLTRATVTIPQSLVEVVYHQASLSKQQSLSTYGFERGQTPVSYIEQNFRAHLMRSVQEFLLQYFVINFLYRNIINEGLLVAGEPRLTSIEAEPHQDACFYFELSTWPSIPLQQWKNFPFKAPKRKNYKDIDRQVQLFIKEELQRLKQHEELNFTLQVGDWVNFNIELVNNNQEPLLNGYHENLWLRIGEEEADASLRNCFLGKQQGDVFYSHDFAFQEYFHRAVDLTYLFRITILSIISHSYVCFENFKNHFRLQTKKDLHQKLIEVFSFRNDLSQRRTMAEEALRLLLIKHPIKIPNHFMLREQQEVLDAVRTNPDYNVYKTQPRFKEYIKKLAEKQIKEALMIDYVAHEEDIQTSNNDVSSYLNFTKRPRIKEFLYFSPPSSKIRGQETPISSLLMQLCTRREKTLNHVIYHLTKR